MSRKSGAARPRKVNGYWYLVRRVPKEFQRIEERRVVMLSTHVRIVDDPRAVKARDVVEQMDAELRLLWRDAIAGNVCEARKRFLAAIDTARSFGCDYVEGPVLKTQFDEFIRRLMLLDGTKDAELPLAMPALLGAVPAVKTGRKVTELLTAYESILSASLMKKSPRQLRRWRTTREAALDVFVKIVGNEKLVSELTHDDGYALRDHWNKRVLAKDVLVDTANKNIGYVAAMVREVNDFERLKLDDIFARKNIRGGEKRSGDGFSVEHVQNVLLAPGALDGLNDEARAIFYVVAELGFRPSEICGLRREHIFLDGEVPYIDVREDGRQVKNKNSIRTTPLVGVALEAMKHFPDGFPRYLDKNDVLSATVNKYLRENELLERPGQTFYSLRHTFKDRLRDTKVEDEFKDMLMGHSTGKEKYGRGYLLKRKQEILTAMAFVAPPVSFGRQTLTHGSEHRPYRAKRVLLLQAQKAT